MQRHIYVCAMMALLMCGPVQAQKIVVGSCTLKDGGIYTGELIGGKPGGKGMLEKKHNNL